jgi:hypothetical protein
MAGFRKAVLTAVSSACIALVCMTGGCSGENGSQLNGGFGPNGGSEAGLASGGGSGGGSSSGFGGNSSGSGCFSCGDASPPTMPSAPCSNGKLDCYVPRNCPNGAKTTLSGTVYDPAGKNPLYNVVVFVPNDPMGKLPAIKVGTNTCNTCDVSIGDYVTVATTDVKGHFTLTGVPATTHVPLVVQTGKWRRETFIDTVTACKDNPVPADDSRLPRNRTEGSLPQMLLMTGGCDDMGCFLRSMGVDASEFSAPHGGGRVDVFTGANGVGKAATLSGGGGGSWGNPVFTKASYEYYDIALFSCECAEHAESAAGRQALHDWLDEGGKVFASHYNYTWFSQGPADFQGTAKWLGMSSAYARGTYTIDNSFPKGQVFEQWLDNLGAASGTSISLASVADSVSAIVPPTVRWIYGGGYTGGSDVKYMSFLTPVGGLTTAADAGETNKYCGKAVFTDLHTGSSITSSVASVPSGCSGAALSPQQDALEFLFFDLSACVGPGDNVPPPPPPPPMPIPQ